MTTRPLRALLVGAGQRGFFAFGPYGSLFPDELTWAAVAEPDDERRARFAEVHHIPRERCFSSWQEALARDAVADVAVIATPDDDHPASATRALAAGYHVLVEKPLATSVEACREVVRAAERSGAVLHVAHVLRHAPFFEKLHEIAASGRLGDLVTVEHRENVAYWHMAHSYVRGSWRSTRAAAPMIVAKCCHDLDLLVWNHARPVVKVSSFGGLYEFTPERAPAGAAERCVSCAVESCAYDARRIYLDDEARWPATAISTDTSLAAREQALASGPYGRCVFRCDNDVVDRQAVLMEHDDGSVSTLVMHGHAAEESRSMRYDGTRATLRGVFPAARRPGRRGTVTARATTARCGQLRHDGEIEVTERGGRVEKLVIPAGSGGHGGGDIGVMRAFLRAVHASPSSCDAAREALVSHELAFAAEEARSSGRVVELPRRS